MKKLKDFMPEKPETMVTSVEVNSYDYKKCKEKLKAEGKSFVDLVNAAMKQYLQG